MKAQASAVDVLRDHPHSQALCERVAEICIGAAERRAPEFLSGPAVADGPTSAVISNAEALTALGNPIEILDRGAQTEQEWALLGAAVALHVARSLGAVTDPKTSELLGHCTWLASETACNPWLFISDCLQPSQLPLWQAVDEHFQAQTHAAQLVLATSLLSAGSADAMQVKGRWLNMAVSPTLVAVLEAGTPGVSLSGQWQPPRRHPLLVCLQLITGYLLLRSAVRLLLSSLFGARSETELTLSPRGLELVHRQRLLGVPLRERQLWVPLEQVRSVTQERRMQGASLYIGLFTLGVGTYIGSGLLWDGLRVPGTSPTLLGFGLLVLLLSLAADFALAYVAPLRRGEVRLCIQRKRGSVIAIGRLKPESTKALLERLVQLRAFEHSSSQLEKLQAATQTTVA